MNADLSRRTRLGYSLGGCAIALRLLSDWIFPLGGPLWYQLVQGALLAGAVVVMRRDLSKIYLKDGDDRRGVYMALMFIPFGVILGIGYSLMLYGSVVLPSTQAWIFMVGNNLFFPLVEELEFRGYFLSAVTTSGVSGGWANLLQAAVHTFAHAHYFFQGNITIILLTFGVFLWLGFIVLKTKSLLGAWIGHASYNIALFTFLIGSGYIR